MTFAETQKAEASLAIPRLERPPTPEEVIQRVQAFLRHLNLPTGRGAGIKTHFVIDPRESVYTERHSSFLEALGIPEFVVPGDPSMVWGSDGVVAKGTNGNEVHREYVVLDRYNSHAPSPEGALWLGYSAVFGANPVAEA